MIFTNLKFRLLGKGLALIAMLLGLTGGYYVLLRQVLRPQALQPLPAPPRELPQANQGPVVPNGPPNFSTVLLTVTASVAAEGPHVEMSAAESNCGEHIAQPPLRVFKAQSGTESLDLWLAQSACIAVAPGQFATGPTEQVGAWASPSLDELPELTSETKQWRYVAPGGQPQYITVAALGYCETEEGDCSASISLVGSDSPASFFAQLSLPGVGPSPLFWLPARPSY